MRINISYRSALYSIILAVSMGINFFRIFFSTLKYLSIIVHLNEEERRADEGDVSKRKKGSMSIRFVYCKNCVEKG